MNQLLPDTQRPGRYVVSVEANRGYEVAQAVRDAELENVQVLDWYLEVDGDFFVVINVSKESLKRIRAMKGVESVDPDHWVIGY